MTHVRFKVINTVYFNILLTEVNSLTEVWFIPLSQSSLIGPIKYRMSSKEIQRNHFLKEQTLVP